MARYHEADIRTAIKTKLDSDFNTMIDTIRAERSDLNIPYALNITKDIIKNQYPEIYIDVTGSDFTNDILDTDIDLSDEVFEVEIKAILKTNSNSLQNYTDYYNEALKRVLHGYNDANISMILMNNTIQIDLEEERSNQTYRMCGVVCQVFVP